MVKIILTGKHEAITLECLRGEQIVKLDGLLVDAKQRNGGFARWFIDIKRGMLDVLFEGNAVHPLRPKKRIPTA